MAQSYAFAPGMAYQPGMPIAQAVPVARAVPLAQAMPVAQALPVAQAFPAGQPRPANGIQPRVSLHGRRRSVLIGINYFGTSSELHGCVNDVRRMQPIVESLGFPSDESSQQVLLDDGSTYQQPTLANIRAAIAWLVSGASAGDALFFHYSGHGGRVNESDGMHETLCPLDMDSEGMLMDTELFEILVRPLPSGCRLTCILDSCHSAGALNLPYLFTGTAANLKKALAGEAVQMAMSRNWAADLAQWQDGNHMAMLSDAASMGLGLWQLWGKYKSSKGANEAGFRTDEQENVGLAVGEVIAITGCASDQTSADVGNVDSQFHLQPTARSGAGGALTSAFIEALENQGARAPSYLELLEQIRQRLANEGFSQVPQLASSLLVDLNSSFSMDTVCLPAQGRARGAGEAGYGSNAFAAPSGATEGGGAAAGFMAALSAAPMGLQMLQTAHSARGGDDGFAMQQQQWRGVGEDAPWGEEAAGYSEPAPSAGGFLGGLFNAFTGGGGGDIAQGLADEFGEAAQSHYQDEEPDQLGGGEEDYYEEEQELEEELEELEDDY